MGDRFDFAGRTVIVTGGASGLGRATCLKFAQSGAKVVVSDLKIQAAQVVAAVINEFGGTAMAVESDVRHADSVENLVKQTVERFGKLDVFVANAGIALAKSLEDTSSAEFDRVLDTNLKGVFWGAKFALPYMKAQGGGRL